jgi:hypothetical protein
LVCSVVDEVPFWPDSAPAVPCLAVVSMSVCFGGGSSPLLIASSFFVTVGGV